MTFNEFKTCVADAAQRLGAADYELYYAAEESTSVGVFQHEINSFSSGLEGGVSFRCLINGRMGYASTEDLSPEEAERIVAAAMDNAASLETDEQEFLGEGGRQYKAVSVREITLASTDDLIKTALETQQAIYDADEAVIDGTETEAVSFSSVVAIVNSRGLDLYHEMKNNVLVTSAVVSDGREMNNSYDINFGNLDEIDITAAAKKSAADAKSKLGADVAPTGAYPVVFAPKAMTSLLSTFAGIFSSENARKGLSRLKDSEGEKIASDALTLVDDPFYEKSLSQMPFDAEGTPSYTKNVIEKGVLKTLLYNMKSAAAMGRQTTGNAMKSGYAAAVGIAPFTMYVAPGGVTEEELLKKAGNGVYIDFLGGLHAGANTISGDFSLQSAGFMIENGVKTKAVKSFTVAGNFYDLLKGVTAVSDEVKLSGVGGVTAFASPSVLVEGLTVAGK